MRSIRTMLTNKPREGESLFHTGQMISIIADGPISKDTMHLITLLCPEQDLTPPYHALLISKSLYFHPS